MLDDAYAKRLQDKIQPENVATALVRAGALLTGYELIKTAIVDEVKGFFVQGFDEDGLIYSKDYERRVLPLGKKRVRGVRELADPDGGDHAGAG